MTEQQKEKMDKQKKKYEIQKVLSELKFDNGFVHVEVVVTVDGKTQKKLLRESAKTWEDIKCRGWFEI